MVETSRDVTRKTDRNNMHVIEKHVYVMRQTYIYVVLLKWRILSICFTSNPRPIFAITGYTETDFEISYFGTTITWFDLMYLVWD